MFSAPLKSDFSIVGGLYCFAVFLVILQTNNISVAVLAKVIRQSRARPLLCYCDGACPGNTQYGTCETRPGGSCFSSIGEVFDENTYSYVLERTYGCMPPEEEGGLFMCKVAELTHRKNIICCNDTNYCNHYQQPELTRKFITTTPRLPISTRTIRFMTLISSLIVLLAALIVFLILLLMTCRYKLRKVTICLHNSNNSSHLTTITHNVEQNSGLRSGSTIVQRTIAKQVQMMHLIGKGRFGEVWLAEWQDEKVAVKIFGPKEEASWICETEFYQTVLMRHENILHYIAADYQGSGSCRQMMLITDYHEYGSLCDYLSTKTINPKKLQLLAYSLASGLAHLHNEIYGTAGKPAIAHRDITSKNILVARNGQCVIAGFGLAVIYRSNQNEIGYPRNTHRGTPRYLPPELLNHTLNPNRFEEFKSADIYSLGLVFWEMSRRCCTSIPDSNDTVCEEYAFPYHDFVSTNPSIADMYVVVYKRGIRPQMPKRWQENSMLVTMSKVMQECWHPNPTCRLTALRVKKTLTHFKSDLKNDINVLPVSLEYTI